MEPPYDPANLNARAAARYDYDPRQPHPPLFVDRPDFYPQHHRHPPFPHPRPPPPHPPPPPPPPPPPQRHHHHHRPSDDPRLYLTHLPPPLPSYRILLPRDPLPHASWDRGRPDPERLRDAAENFRALDRRPSPPPLAWEQGESGAGFLGRKRPRWGEDWILAEEEEEQDMRSQRRIEFPKSVGCRRDPYFDPSPQLDTAPLAPPSRSSRHVLVVPGRAREAFRDPPQSYWSSSHLRSDIQVADGKMALDFDGTIQRETNHGYQEDRHNKGKRKVLSDGWYAENSQQNLRSPWKSNVLNRKQSGVSVWDRIEEKPPPPVWNRIEEKRLPPSPPHGFSPSHGFSEQQPEMDRLDLSYKPTGLVAKVMVPPSPMGLSVEIKPTSLDANATKKKVVKKKVAKKSDMVTAPLVLGLSGSGVKGVTKKLVSSDTPKVPNQLEEKGEVMATSAKPVDDASPHLCLKKMTTMSSSGKNPAKRVAKSIGSVEAGSSEGAKKEGNNISTAKKQLRKCASTKASEIKNKDDISSQLCQQELTVVRSSTKMGGTEQSSGNVDPVEQGRIEGIEEGECVRLDANTARNCANFLVSDLGNVNDSSPPTTRMSASKQANGAANPVEQGSIAGIVEEECVPVDVHAGQNCACSSVSVIGIMNDSSLCTTKMGAPEQSNESVNPVEYGIKGIEEGECMEPNVNAGQNCAEFFISDIGMANNSNLHLSTQGVTEIRAPLESDTIEGLNETITSIENLMAVNPSEEVEVAMEDVEQPVHSDIGFAASIPESSDQVKKVISPAASLTLTIESDSLKGVDEERERNREEKEQQLEIEADMEEIQTPDGGRNKSSDACLHSQVQDMPAPLPLEVKDIVSYVSPPIGFVDGEVTCFSVPVNGGPLKADTLKLVEDSPVVSVFDSLVERVGHPSPFELSKIDSSEVTSASRDAMDCMDMEHSLGQLSDGKGCIDSNNSDNDEKEMNNVDSLLICDKPLVSKSEQDINVGKVMLEDQPNSQRTLASYGSKKQKAPNLEAAGEGVTSRKTIMSAGDLRVLPNRSNLLGSSKGTTHLGFNSRHRTWQRNNSTSSLTPSHGNLHSQGLLHKMSFKKSKLPTTSYIRKGNSLIRKSATEVPFPHHSQGPAASSRVDKAATMCTKDLESSKVINSDQMNCSNPYFERPTTPPLPFSNKLLNSITRPAEDESHQMVEDPIFEAGIEARVGTPESQTLDLVSSGVNNQSIPGGRKTEPLNTRRMIYVRHKSNQLVAARGPVSAHSSIHPVQKAQTLSSNALRDLYHRRKKNQLIRNTLSSEGQSKHVIIPVDSSNSDDQRMYNISSLKHGTTGQFKKRLDKVIQRTHKHSKFSLVWTLRGEESHRKGVSSLNHWNVLPSLFPWKRTLYRKNSTSVSNRRSSLISQNLQLTRKRNMIYTVSTDGFSLRKAGVLGIGGSSLKWSKSIERRSKKANEEATLAVAEEERKKRERKRRTLFVDGGENGNCLSRKSDFGIELQQGERIFRVGSARYKMDASRRTLIRISDVQSTLAVDQRSENNFQNSFVPSRLLIGNDEYIQVGNGNQLVRDPKKLKRILASEKVRWSLHTVRLRLARKQQYCQFFTRFGRCNKNGGKCPYIHDPTKVAICTKFLRGVCSNTDCKLTHKILPERMPDCSYFLRGLCTNVSCPYRHVNVNSKASVCEGFLRGYCAEGDECRKKHSYVCPIFEASGKCPQGSTCKLHHPKSRSATKKRKRRKVEHNSKGRYFGSSIMETGEPLPVASTYPNMERGGDIFYCEGRFTDYFSLDVSSDDDIVQNNATVDSHPTQWDLDLSDMQPDDLDALIKPVRIMNKANLTSGACSLVEILVSARVLKVISIVESTEESQWQQMDIEYTFWQMLHLCTSPKVVYQHTKYHKQTKNQWARDDPAFVVIFCLFLVIATSAYCAAYDKSLTHALFTVMQVVVFHFLLAGIVLATCCWFLTNAYLREEAPNSHVVEQRVEWLYAFDVHCNSFLPVFIMLYVIQYFVSPILVAHGFFPVLLSNLLFMIAISYYHYLNFLGYDVLPFLDKTTFFLYPIGIVIILSPLMVLSGFNPTRYIMSLYFG